MTFVPPQAKNESCQEIVQYQKMLESSWVWEEMTEVRNFGPSFHVRARSSTGLGAVCPVHVVLTRSFDGRSTTVYMVVWRILASRGSSCGAGSRGRCAALWPIATMFVGGRRSAAAARPRVADACRSPARGRARARVCVCVCVCVYSPSPH